jgi:UDPglucose 6-dehydrogenase
MTELEKVATNLRISIFGLGYVGLCTAACFAHRGFQVIGVDVDPKRIGMIRHKKTPIHEPGLKELLEKSIDSKKLSCTQNSECAIKNSDVSIIAVGTPIQRNGSVDLKYLRSVSIDIGKALRAKKAYHLVVVKSTVLPGTTENTVKPLIEKNARKKCGSTFEICYNPEFLREGSAIGDLLGSDKIVIGEITSRSGDVLEELYRMFYGSRLPPIVRTRIATAELIKHANNAFLATKVSFINTIANICQAIPETDVTTVAKAIGLDRRIGPSFLEAGLGYGGSCLPKDVRALTSFAERLGTKPVLLGAVQDVNRLQPCKVIEMAQKLLGDLESKRVAVLGLAFKPNTDDVRDAVSIEVARGFLNKKARVVVYDPMATKNAKLLLGNEVEYRSSALKCIDGADCCVIATAWPEFKTLSWKNFVSRMRTPIVIDGRRIYNPEDFTRKLRFAAIGLGSRAPREKLAFRKSTRRALKTQRRGVAVK